MKAELIEVMGTDLTVVNAARVSMAKESEWGNTILPKNENHVKREAWEASETALNFEDWNLISYLSNNGHWTPFSHPQIMMREKVPIFVARQRFKHMVGFIYNEVSRRYVDDEPEFFIPDVWRQKAKNVKQGSSEDEIVEFLFPDGDNRIKQHIRDQYIHFLGYAESLYDDMLNAGVAPEQARMVLPQSMYTEYYVTGSLAAWARAYKQRIDPHAQKEIRDLAVEWDKIIRPLFPVSWSALVDKE